MSDPIRLRLSRARDFDLQAHSLAVNGLAAVNVARPTPLGNPFVGGRASVDEQRQHFAAVQARMADLHGRNLACWCSLDGTCHADALLELANA